MPWQPGRSSCMACRRPGVRVPLASTFPQVKRIVRASEMIFERLQPGNLPEASARCQPASRPGLEGIARRAARAARLPSLWDSQTGSQSVIERLLPTGSDFSAQWCGCADRGGHGLAGPADGASRVMSGDGQRVTVISDTTPGEAAMSMGEDRSSGASGRTLQQAPGLRRTTCISTISASPDARSSSSASASATKRRWSSTPIWARRSSTSSKGRGNIGSRTGRRGRATPRTPGPSHPGRFPRCGMSAAARPNSPRMSS